MKNKILVLLLLFIGVFGFTTVVSHAQSEFIDDKFVISNEDYNINEEDAIEFMLFLRDYVVTYDLLEYDEFDDTYYTDLSNVTYGGLNIDFNAVLPTLEYSFNLFYYPSLNTMIIIVSDYNHDIVINLVYYMDTQEFEIVDIASYGFSIVISSPDWIPEPPEYVFTKLFDLIYTPLDIMLDYIGINQQTLSIGFGNIEWFNLEIVLILKLVLSILIVWVFTKFIYWFVKGMFSMITGWLK